MAETDHVGASEGQGKKGIAMASPITDYAAAYERPTGACVFGGLFAKIVFAIEPIRLLYGHACHSQSHRAGARTRAFYAQMLGKPVELRTSSHCEAKRCARFVQNFGEF